MTSIIGDDEMGSNGLKQLCLVVASCPSAEEELVSHFLAQRLFPNFWGLHNELGTQQRVRTVDQLGLTPEEVISKIMANPEVAMAFQNPRVQAAIMDCLQNPLSIAKYRNDKELVAVSNTITFANPNSPVYPRLAQGKMWNEMTVTWTSRYGINEAEPFVEWGPQGGEQRQSLAGTLTFDRNSMCDAPARTVGWRDPEH
ncbi:putative inactive purple acid phosphatase 1 [Camellia lanceoleosa]|uniref:Inactive purple acid phosphatase 1 n=1 Tax=Camellia lanceoleosa TaxID=1840588 RepID=A0ACC0GFI1_9ERIC|nr:putative inactive purple acid phosphatase 1 [Camellia lanceoleosa]